MSGPYKQDINFLVSGPGLPDPGCVSVGADELNIAYEMGRKHGHGAFCCCDECKKR